MNDDRPLLMPGVAALALAAIVAVRFVAPSPDAAFTGGSGTGGAGSGALPYSAGGANNAAAPAQSISVALTELATPKSGGVWNAPGNRIFSSELIVELGEPKSINRIDLSLDNNDTYRLEIGTAVGFLPLRTLEPTAGYGLVRREIKFAIPSPPTAQLRIVAVSGDGYYSLGHLIVE